MAFGSHQTEDKVLASINQRTLVNGRKVATEPIAVELDLSPDELRQALEALAERGYIVVGTDLEATLTPEGHTHTP